MSSFGVVRMRGSLLPRWTPTRQSYITDVLDDLDVEIDDDELTRLRRIAAKKSESASPTNGIDGLQALTGRPAVMRGCAHSSRGRVIVAANPLAHDARVDVGTAASARHRLP